MLRPLPTSLLLASVAVAGVAWIAARAPEAETPVAAVRTATAGEPGARSPERRDAPHRGMSIETDYGAYAHAGATRTLHHLRRIGVDWVQVVPFAFQPAVDRPELRFRDHTETQTAFIRRAHELGFGVLLKPHVWSHAFWPSEGEGAAWRGDIRMRDAADWRRWFAGYGEFLLHYARLAEREGVEVLCIGLEYVHATREQPERWRELIRRVRAVYGGRLTYGAHLDRELDRIPFWSDLDAIGVVAYPPLARDERDDVATLTAGWEPTVARLRALSERVERPVLIVEVGFTSLDTTARAPWSWSAGGAREVDLAEQASCYEATLRALWGQPWLEGLYFWKWSIDPAAGGPHDRHYTPKGKPAEKVLRRWFAPPAPAATPAAP